MEDIKDYIFDKIGQIIRKIKNFFSALKWLYVVFAIAVVVLTQFIASSHQDVKIYFQILLAIIVGLQAIIMFLKDKISQTGLEVMGKLKESYDELKLYDDNLKESKLLYDSLATCFTTIPDNMDYINQFIKSVHSLKEDEFSGDEVKKELQEKIRFICDSLYENSAFLYVPEDQRADCKLKISIYMINEKKDKLFPVYIASDITTRFRDWDLQTHQDESFIVKCYSEKKLLICEDWEKAVQNIQKSKEQKYDKEMYRSIFVIPIMPNQGDVKEPIGVIALSSGKAGLWSEQDKIIVKMLESLVQIILVLWYNIVEKYSLGSLDPIAPDLSQEVIK